MVISGQCLFWDWSFLTVSYGTSEVLPHFDISPLWLVGIWTFSIYVCILGTVWPTFCWFFLQPYVHKRILMYAQTNFSPKTKGTILQISGMLYEASSSPILCPANSTNLAFPTLIFVLSTQWDHWALFHSPSLFWWPGNCLQTVSWGNCSSSFVSLPSTITVLHFLLCTV